jgi:hypothetical protein
MPRSLLPVIHSSHATQLDWRSAVHMRNQDLGAVEGLFIFPLTANFRLSYFTPSQLCRAASSTRSLAPTPPAGLRLRTRFHFARKLQSLKS